MEKVKIAVAKGRLADYAINLLHESGLDCSELQKPSRKLVFEIPEEGLEIILLKAADVPTYVEHGVVDVGIVGKDTLLEADKQLYEVLDLKFGKCKFAVAGKVDLPYNKMKHLTVASKYTNVTKKFFAEKGQSVEVIKQEGSVELAPIMGLADVIVDIVETGKTLKENGLIVLEDVAQISARLVVNKVSFKTKKKKVTALIERISKEIDKGEK
ncbi:ATP phosphoribosyltransferase [Serpentinicella sp. ANB-PHB4]|uniref:ATP phosphoribosyltransferase n=1 Tax=Serpentinicella sp. ANB-PHB4 TaxID=3074076 RepID=UPI002864B35A|nr:ATP phosphoribosyltransferase [Serpentinicella sp. ANB-PHB4]MDR5659757.1 ATP phosphoribosyltransferase [Serpentinicella sp. ANB-PHB4]